MADTLWELQKDGIIKAWSWAPNENEFFEPMTKPALSADQRDWLLAEYFIYFKLIQAEPKKTFKQICSEYLQKEFGGHIRRAGGRPDLICPESEQR
jgi:hypothetical protein